MTKKNKKYVHIFDGLYRSLDRLDYQAVYMHGDDVLEPQTAGGLIRNTILIAQEHKGMKISVKYQFL